MSLSVEPDYQTFIVRIAAILRASALIFPKSVGGDDTVEDLVTQIIENQLPIPQLTVEGPGPPHIFVAQSEVPQVSSEQRGRDSRDVQGGKRVTLEFYIVIISAAGRDRQEAEASLFPIISAVTTELGKNMRLIDPATSLDPLSITHKYNVAPYIFDITQNETVAKNVILRPVLGVNLR